MIFLDLSAGAVTRLRKLLSIAHVDELLYYLAIIALERTGTREQLSEFSSS